MVLLESVSRKARQGKGLEHEGRIYQEDKRDPRNDKRYMDFGADIQIYNRYDEGGMKMKDERKFKEVMHTIKGAEKDKDKFCKAARIERQPMSQEKFETLLGYIALYLGMILVFALFFTFFYLCR